MQQNAQQNIIKGLQLFTKAQTLHAGKQYADADIHYRQALKLMPDHPKILQAYAQLAEDVADWPAAEKLYQKIGHLRPDSHYEIKLGAALFQQEKFQEAIPFFETHLSSHPEDANTIHGLSMALCSMGHWEQGLAQAQRAFALMPDPRFLDAVLNALFHLARTDELDACIDQALARFPNDPGIRSMYALHTLKSGRYADGFKFIRDMRWRNNLNAAADSTSPAEQWDGKKFSGTLLVGAEQGLGDEIMVSSLFDDLVDMGQKALIECDTRLMPLYQRAYPALEFVSRQEKILRSVYKPDGTFRKTRALDMGAFFRKSQASFPTRKQWLYPDAKQAGDLRAAYQARWPGKRIIGLSWKSNRTTAGGGSKTLRTEDLLPLFAIPDCVFVSLQYGNIDDDLAILNAAGQTLYVDPNIDPMTDIDGFAAQVAAMDLTLSISNTTVHVAGALGAPCWMLLPKTGPILWYWGYRGDTTPWYPAVHIYRNTQEENWQDCINTLAARLAQPEKTQQTLE